jgi:hypothetical protein
VGLEKDPFEDGAICDSEETTVEVKIIDGAHVEEATAWPRDRAVPAVTI